MEAFEKGVLPPSVVYLHTPSVLAEGSFFFPLCTGHYFCDGTYEVTRGSYDSFLAIYVAEGSGYLQTRQRAFPLGAGSFALVDCYQPHTYGTRSGWEFYWLHFDGVMARRYFDLCTQNNTFAFEENTKTCAHQLCKIFEAFHAREKVNEILMSKRIADLLTDLMLFPAREKGQLKRIGVIEDALLYISEHVDGTLSLEELARHVSLSPFYFSRLFKKETGYTPHEYVMRARVDRAKYLLKASMLPLKEIAFCCGFSNECNFSTAFKKISGDTPRLYRNRET